MGYTTDFEGSVIIDPPLNEKEVAYLNKFSDTRRMNRTSGPYYCGKGMAGQDHESDIIDYNRPPDGQPGLWCQWVANEEGTEVEWDGGEKFYHAAEWMQYIIDHFIGENPLAKLNDPDNFSFLQGGHKVNGDIFAEGEESGDHWKIEVRDGIVTTKDGQVTYD